MVSAYFPRFTSLEKQMNLLDCFFYNILTFLWNLDILICYFLDFNLCFFVWAKNTTNNGKNARELLCSEKTTHSGEPESEGF